MKMNNILSGRKGFSLLELVIGLTMIMIMLPSSIVVFQQVLQYKTIAEARITCANLAQMVLEHETQKRFSSVDTIQPANFEDATITVVQEDGTPGTEPNPYRDDNLVHQFINYNFEMKVACVWDGANGLNPDLDAWTEDPTCQVGRSKEFKRVEVLVTNPLADTVHLTTLVTDTSDPICGGHTISNTDACETGEKSCNPVAGEAPGKLFCVETACDCPNIH